MLLYLRNIYYKLWQVPLIKPLLHRLEYPIKFILFFCCQPGLRRQWKTRIEDVIHCPDNRYIPRVKNAGKIIDGCLVMHNGLRIIKGSYYGIGNLLLLKYNRGVHEPQEERIFMEVLKYMPEDAVMIELGAYWGFYSMWFHKEVKRPTCYLVEPEQRNLEFGKDNFAVSNMTGSFRQGFVGAMSGKTKEGIDIICVDDYIRENNVKRVNILHADIQGAEYDMLTGAADALHADKIDYIFISTHTNELHQECLAFLNAHNFHIIAEADVSGSYSVDGIIAARRGSLQGLGSVNISKYIRR
ncbi:MAG: FkbM family methyltransferase [Nitrospirota bacterium]